MKTNILLLFGIMAFVLEGCYDDKGNYDYKDMNDLIFQFNPESPTGDDQYKYRQPSVDTLRVTYSPVIRQSLRKEEDNLEFQWLLTYPKGGKQVTDTLYTKELALTYAPNVRTTYTARLRITDHATGTDFYRELNMKTEVPFVKSWFVLHGNRGNRKLGTVENPNSPDSAIITLDAYESVWGTRRFKNIEHMIYSPFEDANSAPERITLISADSLFYMQPFSLVVNKKMNQMMPPGISHPALSYGVSDDIGTNTIIVDAQNKFYHAGLFGYYFTAKTQPEVSNYLVDKIFITEGRIAILWDKEQKKFMYYSMYENGYPLPAQNVPIHPGNDQGNYALLTPFPEDLYQEKEWENREVVWVGRSIHQDPNSQAGATALVRTTDSSLEDATYYLYHIDFGGDPTSFVHLQRDTIGKLDLDANSFVATSIAFEDQLFYSKGSIVYLYNTVSKEKIELYDAGGPITKIQFRLCNKNYMGDGEEHCLGVVVNYLDGDGELHELFLDEAGDVVKKNVHKGFGAIVDIVFTTIQRII